MSSETEGDECENWTKKNHFDLVYLCAMFSEHCANGVCVQMKYDEYERETASNERQEKKLSSLENATNSKSLPHMTYYYDCSAFVKTGVFLALLKCITWSEAHTKQKGISGGLNQYEFNYEMLVTH